MLEFTLDRIKKNIFYVYFRRVIYFLYKARSNDILAACLQTMLELSLDCIENNLYVLCEITNQ